jgi:hypothetical protein
MLLFAFAELQRYVGAATDAAKELMVIIAVCLVVLE